MHERNTDFVSIYPRSENDHIQVGKWVLREMRSAVELCLLKHVKYPDIRLTTSMISQQDYDSIEVEDFLIHAELFRNA
jgi:hypothetical protein